ncbi:MAG: DUF1080 domain-containing protein [Armatimonadetes bacterium]|nr:DUF1080 domain-containing protein [Armatimonadota bacterium]
MKKAIWAVVALLAVGSMAQTDPRVGPKTKLFNGKDMAGWNFLLSDKNLKMEDVWSVDPQQGIIVCKGTPAGYIYTNQNYTSFILTLEWRWSPVTKHEGNSGVLLRVQEPHKIWPKSIEAQLYSKHAGDFWLIDGAKLETDEGRINKGAPNNRVRMKTNEKAAGEWNHYEIIVDGDKVTLKVNGELVNEGKGAEVIPGKIALQSEGAEIHFRNIEIRPIRN